MKDLNYEKKFFERAIEIDAEFENLNRNFSGIWLHHEVDEMLIHLKKRKKYIMDNIEYYKTWDKAKMKIFQSHMKGLNDTIKKVKNRQRINWANDKEIRQQSRDAIFSLIEKQIPEIKRNKGAGL